MKTRSNKGQVCEFNEHQQETPIKITKKKKKTSKNKIETPGDEKRVGGDLFAINGAESRASSRWGQCSPWTLCCFSHLLHSLDSSFSQSFFFSAAVLFVSSLSSLLNLSLFVGCRRLWTPSLGFEEGPMTTIHYGPKIDEFFSFFIN